MKDSQEVSGDALAEWALGRTLVIRADADPLTGTGHVMRCIALAQAWNMLGGTVILHTAPIPTRLEDFLRRVGCTISIAQHHNGDSADASELTAIAREADATWIVQDGYHLRSEYQTRIKAAGFRLLAIDDLAEEPSYGADIVLNQNIYASAHDYRDSGRESRLLLGPEYVLLREDFWRWRGREKHVDEMKHALITFGGSDPRNMTGMAMQAMADVEGDFMLRVIVGPSNPRLEEIRAQAQDCSLETHVLNDVQSMAEILDWADIAVSAAGSATYEFAFMGVPALIVQTADNQRRGAPILSQRGIAVDLGWHSEITRERVAAAIREMIADNAGRTRMARLGQAAVDGMGVLRAISCMKGQSEDRSK
jgi:UDP-2,4-diacetamido-2,4,6-trideoxy-beta-L-altropyranose hydrolase